MSEVKLPYYPKRIVVLNESPFGVPEIDCPKIYENPLENKYILRVDILEALRALLGDECLFYREHVYDVVSGNTKDFNRSIQHYYNKFPHFRSFVNEEYYYGDSSQSLSDRMLSRMNSLLLQFEATMRSRSTMSGGKYLVYTHYYLYYAYLTREAVPNVDGGFIIC